MKKMSKVKMGMSKKLVKADLGYNVTSQTTQPTSPFAKKIGTAGSMIPPAYGGVLSTPSVGSSSGPGFQKKPAIPAPGAKRKEVSKERDATGNYVTKEKQINTPQGSRTIQKKRRTGLGFARNAAYQISGGKIGQDVPRPMKKGGSVKKSKKK